MNVVPFDRQDAVRAAAPPRHGHRVDQELWAMAAAYLREDLGAAVFDRWCRCIAFERIEGRQLFLSVPTVFLRSWNRTHYYEPILRAARTIWPDLDGVTIDLRGAARGSLPPCGRAEIKAAAPAPMPAPPRRVPLTITQEVGSPLDRRFTFESFVAGASNRMAHATTEMIIKGGWPVTPLVVQARSGLGKTHLLQALALAVRETGRTALYLTIERFMYGIAAGIKGSGIYAALAAIEADVVIIDDLQFLRGASIAEAVCRLIDEAPLKGRNIVFSSDCSVLDLELKDERLRSRLSAGLTIAIDPFDIATRIGILRKHVALARVRTPALAVPDDVIAHVAGLVQGQGRDLIGAVNRLQAQASLLGFAMLTKADGAAAVADLVRQPDPKRVKIETIQAVVAEHFNVTRADMMSARRTANVVRPRQIAMYLAKVLTLRSMPEIGRRFGGRDHTTVLHAVRKIEQLNSVDTSVAADPGISAIADRGEVVRGDNDPRLRDAWIGLARKLFSPGEREPCCVCGKFKSIAQAHHVIPLTEQFDRGFKVPDGEYVWLCPNHHAMVHLYIMRDERSMAERAMVDRDRTVAALNPDLSEDEWTKLLELKSMASRSPA